MGCGSGATTTTTSGPPAQVLQAYQNITNQASNVAGQPLQTYTGPVVAGFTPDQMRAFGTIENAQGISQPYINNAASLFQTGAQPITPMSFSGSTVGNLMSPYIGQVANATEAQLNNQNAAQLAQVAGSAAQQGAYGGDREAVAQALTANQQQLAEAPVLANLYNTGYNTALGEFNTLNQANIGAQEATGWLQQGAGYGLGNLGTLSQNTALSGANALLTAGGLQQQQAQQNLNIPYEEFLQQQAYPFQTTGWEANIAEGLGGASGGVSSTTAPPPSALSQVAGLGVTGLGLYGLGNSLGWFGSGVSNAAALGGVDAASAAGLFSHRGGRIPRLAAGGMSTPLIGNVGVPNVAVSFVPTAPGAPGGAGRMGLSPMQPNTSTTQSAGGSLLNDIGPALMVAKLATTLRRGGEVDGYAGGGTPTAPAVAAGAPASTAPGSGLPGSAPFYRFTPQTVDPNVSVALPVHAAPTLGALPTTAPGGSASLTHIQPIANYAPTFNSNGYPASVQAVAPGSVVGAPLSLPLSNGIINRSGSTPTTASSTPLIPPPASTQYDPNTYIDWSSYNPTGGMQRGGLVGFDDGGTVPDLSKTYVPANSMQGAGRSTIPTPPHVTQDNPLQNATSIGNAVGSLQKLLPKGSGSGGPVDLTSAFQHFDDGGSVQQAGQAASGGLNPLQAGFLNQYANLSTEQLQELAMRAPPNSLYGQAINRALQIKKMAPGMSQPLAVPGPTGPMAQTSLAAPAGPTVGQQQQQGTATSALSPTIATAWRGGRQHFDNGGFADPTGAAAGLEPVQGAFSSSDPTITPDPYAFNPLFHPAPKPHDFTIITPDMPKQPAMHGDEGLYLGNATPSSTASNDIAYGHGNWLNDHGTDVAPTDHSDQQVSVPTTTDSGNGLSETERQHIASLGPEVRGRLAAGDPWGAVRGAPGVRFNSNGEPYSSDLDTMSAADKQNVAASMAALRHSGFPRYSGDQPNALNPTGGVGLSSDQSSPSEPSRNGIPFSQARELIGEYESGNNYNVGFGGVDLSNAPHDADGFPIWEGTRGPDGISHAAGFYQFEPATWHHYAQTLGIHDFSPESQDAVARLAYLDQGFAPWAPYNPRLNAAIHGGNLAGSGSPDTVVRSGRAPGIATQNSSAAATPTSNIPSPANLSTAYTTRPIEHGIGANKWLPLIAAGLGMMASRSPYPGVAIGEGGLAGVKTAEGQEAQSVKSQELQNSENYRNRQLGLEAARLNQTTNYQGAELAQKAMQFQQTMKAENDRFAIEMQNAKTQADREAVIAQHYADTDAINAAYKKALIMRPINGFDEKGVPGVWQFDPQQGQMVFKPGVGSGRAPAGVIMTQQQYQNAVANKAKTIQLSDPTLSPEQASREAERIVKESLANAPSAQQTAQPRGPSPEAIVHLRQNPGLSKDFDQWYGAGAAEKILGQ